MKTSTAEKELCRVMIRWAGHVAHMRWRKHIYGAGRPGHRCKDNIKMDLRYIWWEDVDWIHLAQDKDKWWALVTTGTNFQAQKLLGICKLADQLCFSRCSDRQVCVHMVHLVPICERERWQLPFFMLPDLMFQNINL